MTGEPRDPAPAATRPKRRVRFGLGGRLAGALLVVVSLFLLANYLIERTTWDTAQRVAHIEDEREPYTHLAEVLDGALAAYDRAVLARIDPHAPATPAAVEAARASLLTAAGDYRRTVGDRAVRLPPDLLDERITGHVHEAHALIESSSKRPALVAAYRAKLDALAADATHGSAAAPDLPATERALKALNQAFDSDAQDGSESHIAALAAAETDLRRALGTARAVRLRGEQDALAAAGDALTHFDRHLTRDIQQYKAGSRELVTLVHAGVAEPAREDQANADREAGATITAARRSLAKVTVALVLLVALVWLALAHDFMRPMRQLAHAARSMVAGNLGARAEVGGSQELDELAQAFNSLADDLASARQAAAEHQEQLEERVHERTAALAHLADHDPLTELPNQRRMRRHLEETLTVAAGGVGLILVELDQFKVLNDHLGRQLGDQVLQAASARVRAVAGTSGFAARSGGVEFTVVGVGLSAGAALALAQRVVHEFQQPLAIAGRELVLPVSVGVAVAPEHAGDAAALLAAAGAALTRAKAEGGNRACLYRTEFSIAEETRAQLERALRRAWEEGALEVLYQPRVALHSLELDGVEALLRWRRTDGQLISPEEFLSVAERSGLILELGDFVLQAAVEQAAAWRRAGWSDARVAVNVAAEQLIAGGFAARVEHCLARARLPARALELEIAEAALDTGPHTIAAVARLREQGVEIALDEFGTGAASLMRLERLPLSRVKIDRTLIGEVDSNPRIAAVVRSIIRLCDDLALRVIALGVERASQLQALTGHGPLSIQGYWLARPMPGPDLLLWRATAREHLESLARPETPVRRAAVVALGVARRGRRRG
jgi:diguanylate cyclase (GGDEF)-like protein